jgi:hypothetical protein
MFYNSECETTRKYRLKSKRFEPTSSIFHILYAVNMIVFINRCNERLLYIIDRVCILSQICDVVEWYDEAMDILASR